MSAQYQWGAGPGIAQPIDPAPLRLPTLPQYGYKSAWYMPRPEALAKGFYYGVPFTFGTITNPLPARSVQQVNVQFPRDVQAWGWTAFSTDTSGAGGTAMPYGVLITHQLEDGSERLWTPRRTTNLNIFGTAQYPAWFKTPQLVMAGETLQMEISLEAAVAVNQIQALLHCTLIVEGQ
jgi:hypothetical protein